MFILSLLTGCYFANLCQIGTSLSQIVMDYFHYLEHSPDYPSLIYSTRSYHKLHHNKFNHNFGFGLTFQFWDLVFSTLPNKKKKR